MTLKEWLDNLSPEQQAKLYYSVTVAQIAVNIFIVVGFVAFVAVRVV